MKVCSYILTIFYVFFLPSASTSAGHGFSADKVNIPEGSGPLVVWPGLGFGSFLLILIPGNINFFSGSDGRVCCK